MADFQADHGAGAGAAPASPLGGALQSLGEALGGETAVYVSPGAPIPAVTLVTRRADPQGVLDALHCALAKPRQSAGRAEKTGSFDLGPLLGALQLSHAVVGGRLVVSTSQAGGRRVQGRGQKLGDDGTFRRRSPPRACPRRRPASST